jgi:hypothetical protein
MAPSAAVRFLHGAFGELPEHVPKSRCDAAGAHLRGAPEILEAFEDRSEVATQIAQRRDR